MNLLQRHPRALFAAAVIFVALAAFVVVWFEPQKLFQDDRVDEAAPVSRADGTDQGAGSDDATDDEGDPDEVNSEVQAMTLARGSFRPIGHQAMGDALLLRTSDGVHHVRFADGFEVENGPDLFVYLSTAPFDAADEDAFVEDFVDLGELKGNIGSQNYKIPSKVDIERFRSVVVWCKRFSVAFASASIS